MDLNKTLLVLIQKKKNADSLRDYRPISLCNVSYKIITKTVVNRIKPLLSRLIGPAQTSFVSGRQITDNIVLAQEIIHSMRNKKGKKGWMACKIDLTKAYDMLRWDFIHETLVDVGFPELVVSVIMNCITTPSMEILWNGDRTSSFIPSRGIRQGDPMSPYIFVLCIERLAQHIQQEASHGNWQPICIN